MPFIKSLCINAIQLPHAYRKISIGGINQKVVMIIHQAVGVAKPIVPKGYIFKGTQENLSIPIVGENRFSLVSSACDMIDSTRKLYTQRTCHRYPISLL
jgi:hypothetical protein